MLPHEPGVYRFRDAGGRVRYLGRATDLHDRVSSYWSDLGDRRHLSRMVAAVTRIEAVVCSSVHEACWLERLLLETLQAGPGLPSGNRTAGGQESPVWLSLDARARTAGLTVRHDRVVIEGTACFGPYLGGSQVRRALAGLGRVLPLGYTATGLTGSGLGMAAVRSITPADGPRLVAELTSVLSGDPAAIGRTTTSLTRLRDEASSAQAFELAARIQAEILALGWITSEKRVYRVGAGEQVLYGWSGGVLVEFMITNGRLVGWQQRRCSAERAAEPVAGTRLDWRPFADRNAALAAALVTAHRAG